MIINNPNAPFIPPFNPFIVPSSFYDSWTQEEQIVYLAENKQGRLIPGTGIYIQDNEDGTYTISSDGGTGEGHTYEVRAVTHPSEGNVAEYKLIDLLTGEQSGATIVVPEVTGIDSIITVEGASKATVTINLTNGTSQSFDVQYGRDGQDGAQGPQGERGPQGETGERGPQGAEGPKGDDGYSPTVTVTPITGGHRVVITTVEGSTSFDIMDGVDGTDGTDGRDGVTPNITVSGSILPMGGSALPIVTVTKTGTPENPNFDFQFANLKGEKGDTGAAGADGTDGTDGVTPNISISASILPISGSITPAAPYVEVDKSGTPAAPHFDFKMYGLEGGGGGSLPSGGNKGNVLTLKDPATNEAEWYENYPIIDEVGSKCIVIMNDYPIVTFQTPGDFIVSNIQYSSQDGTIECSVTNKGSSVQYSGTIKIRCARITPTGTSNPTLRPSVYQYGGYFNKIDDELYEIQINPYNQLQPGETYNYSYTLSGGNLHYIHDMKWIHTLPSGGNTGQVLSKVSNNNYDVQWSAPGGGTSFDYIDWMSMPGGLNPGFGMTKNRLTLSNDNSTPMSFALSAVTFANCSCEINGDTYNFDLTISLNSLEEIYSETYNLWIDYSTGIQASVDSPPVMYNDGIANWSNPPCTAQISNPSLTVNSVYIAPQYVDMSMGLVFVDWNNSIIELKTDDDFGAFNITQIYPDTPPADHFEPDDSSHLESSSTSGDYCLGPKTIE